MKSIKRRTFLVRSVGAAAGLGLAGCSSSQLSDSRPSTAASGPAQRSHRPNRIAVSTYSFWRFKEGLKLPIETCIDQAAEMGFDAVEILQIQMEKESNEYLQDLKRRAIVNGLDLCSLGIQAVSQRYL